MGHIDYRTFVRWLANAAALKEILGGVMRRQGTIAMLVVTLGMTGCMVPKAKYMDAVAESEAAKTDLEKTRAMKTALEQQVKSLKDLNGKLTADAELVHAEIQRIRDSREKERDTIEGR